MHSLAVYDLLVDVLQGRVPRVRHRRVAFEAPAWIWERVLAFEGCAAQADRALVHAGLRPDASSAVDRLLRSSSNAALSSATLALRTLGEVAALASTAGARVIVLKGAARLLAGELPGTRAMSDIDLLLARGDAARFHRLLQTELGFRVSGQNYSHHLPALVRPGSIGIELHRQLADTALELDGAMFRDTRIIHADGHPLAIPSPTNILLHTLEHATRLNWMVHYRLRDILDVAALVTPDVSVEALQRYVRLSSRRLAMETLLSAAHELQPLSPSTRDAAWQTVRRVARARLALATVPRDRTTANRVYRYASLIAEGTPRTMIRAGASLLRRMRTAMLPVVAVMLAACSESTRPSPLDVPAFIFVSDSNGTPGLYRWNRDTVTRLSDAGQEDEQPHSAAGRVVFMSRRDGNPEIYISSSEFTDQQRLTNDGSFDGEPVLNPGGTTIAFVSSRSGTPRIWLMDMDGANARPLDTGSPTFTPEGSPAWSPSGDRIAFTSTRTNTSQVFVLDTITGDAEQLSHESGGAFTPTWSSSDGTVLYVSLLGVPRVMRISPAGGAATIVASGDRVLSDPACLGDVCVAVAGADAGNGDIIAVSAGRAAAPVLARSANDRQPAFLIP